MADFEFRFDIAAILLTTILCMLGIGTPETGKEQPRRRVHAGHSIRANKNR
jgi:hypothetical protein